ncbi:hypothetical protein D3C71_79440 [compost metagenome]
MRKFIQNVALEEEQQAEAEAAQAAEAEAAERAEQENISLEEEALVIADAATDAAESATELAETERIIEVSDALEDMAVIAGEIKEATPVETQLIETVGTMAVAGTDIAPEEVVPALEGVQDLKPHLEKVKATAKRIWEQILTYLKGIWEKIEAFFYKQFGTIPRLQAQLVKLQNLALDAAKGESSTPAISVTGTIHALSVSGKQVSGEADIAANLATMHEAAKYVYGGYSDALVKRGEVIAKAIAEFTPEKADEVSLELKKSLRQNGFGSIPGAGAGSNARYPGFDSRMGKPLPGGYSLVNKHYIENKGDASLLSGLDRARREGVDLVKTDNAAGPAAAGKVEMKTITTAGATNLVKDALELLKTIEDFKRGAKPKAIQKARKDIESASSKATAAIDKAKPGADGPVQNLGTAVTQYRALLNFNASFARWSRDPQVQFTAAALATARAVAIVVTKSLATYKVAPEAKAK